MQSNYLSLYTLFFSHSLFYAYFPYQRLLLFGLFFFPFPLISKTGLLNTLLQGVAAKKNISQNRSFCQAPFAFFSFYFLSFFSSVRKKTKHQQRLPPSYRNIKKDNHLLLFQTLFGIINTHLYQTGLLG